MYLDSKHKTNKESHMIETCCVDVANSVVSINNVLYFYENAFNFKQYKKNE